MEIIIDFPYFFFFY